LDQELKATLLIKKVPIGFGTDAAVFFMEIMPKICLNDGGWYASYESYSSSYNGYYFRNGEENYGVIRQAI
jgi:hypothetical protein